MESAFSIPLSKPLVFGESRAAPPHAASTCSQRYSRRQTSTISSSGSIAPFTVVPAVAITQNGIYPALFSDSICSSNFSIFIFPDISQGIAIRFFLPIPNIFAAIIVE